MQVTVAICTWNRANLLDQTLERMRALRIPEEVEWELLVVNNNCTDHTDEVIARHADALPIRRLLKTQQGLSHARNCAIDAAQGELLIWTDDDVLVDSEWLAEYARLSRERDEFTFFGGPVEPWFEGDPPTWLEEILQRVSFAYAVRDLGEEELEFDDRKQPFGANFAIRTAVQQQYRYNPNLGRKAKVMTSGEETDVLARLQADGFRGCWAPTAKVKHFIPQSRQSTEYLMSYYGGFGRLSAAAREDQPPILFGRPRWLWRAWLSAEVAYRFKRLTARPSDWIESLITLSHLRGQLSYYASASRPSAKR